MKPDWKDAPEWAQWLAMDSYGEWYWFQEKPLQGEHSWILGGGNWQQAGTSYDWIASLESSP